MTDFSGIPSRFADDPAFRAEAERRVIAARQQEDQSALAQFHSALLTDPTAEGEAIEIASKLTPPVSREFVRGNLDVAREMQRRQAVRYEALRRDAPDLWHYVRDNVDPIRVGHDDVPNLKQAANLWRELRMSFRRGWNATSRGYLGTRAMASGLTPEIQQQVDAIDGAAYNQPFRQGWLAHAAETLGNVASVTPEVAGAGTIGLLASPAGAAIGATTAVTATSTAIEGGNSYLDLRALGFSHDDARNAAIGVGIINGLLETVGGHMVTAPMRAAAKRLLTGTLRKELTGATARAGLAAVLKTYAAGVGSEVATEVAQELVNYLAETSSGRPKDAPAVRDGELWGRLWDIASKTAQGISILGIPGAVTHFRSEMSRVKASQAEGAFYESFSKNVEASKVGERAPDVMSQYIASTSRNGPVTDVYVNAAEADKVLQQLNVTPEELAKVWPSAAAQLDQTKSVEDADIVTPIAEFAKVARGEIGVALKPHVRLSEKTYSAAQLEAEKPRIEAMRAEADKAMKASEEIAAEAKTIEDTAREQIKTSAAGSKLTAEQIDAVASLHRDSVVALAARLGKKPSQVAPVFFTSEQGYAKMLQDEQARKVAGGDLHAQLDAPTQFDQLGRRLVNTPEFGEWFGSSVVRDENGEPLVQYHATTAQFDTFARTSDIGFHFGTAQAALDRFGVTAAWVDYANGDRSVQARNGAKTLPVFLSIRNPIELPDLGAWNPLDVHHHVRDAIAGTSKYTAIIELLRDHDFTTIYDAFSTRTIAAQNEFRKLLIQALEEAGYDGVKYINRGEDKGSVSWIAFKPEQIKLATAPSIAKSQDGRWSPRMLEQTRIKDITPAISRLLKNLTPEERAKLTDKTAAKVLQALKKFPSSDEMAAVAVGGIAKRGWYRRSAEALVAIFGADAPRFAMLLAALSPQNSVESNLANTLRVWREWVAVGRPTDRAGIIGVLGRALPKSAVDRRSKKPPAKAPKDATLAAYPHVLKAWVNNSVTALSTDDPTTAVLSGPKVNSFYRNLIGDTTAVTLDAWIANYALVDQALFGAGSLNVAGTDPGKSIGYLAMSARVRETAAKLTKLTGETWTPAEVQETVWSWAYSLYKLQAKDLLAPDALTRGLLTDELINATPDFGSLFYDQEYADVLRDAGYGPQLDALAVRADAGQSAADAASQAAPFTAEDRRRYQLRAAARLAKLKRQRDAEKRAARAANARAVRQRGRVSGGSGLLQQSRSADSYAKEPALEGLPTTVKVDGRDVEFGPLPAARQAAAAYMAGAGMDYRPSQRYVDVDVERATRIAAAFDAMKHDPKNPDVKAAYQALADETIAQWRAIKDTGLVVEFMPDSGDPYASNPRKAIQDVRDNNHLYIFPTLQGFGGPSSEQITESPMLAVVDGETISGRPVTVNDLFRVVHDYFGHIKEGVGFRARGEENAWQQHMAMYSPLARKAATTETRGQNSWVNFGPFAEKNKTASQGATEYAPQKVGLLPDWVLTEGYDVGPEVTDGNATLDQLRIRGLGAPDGSRPSYGEAREGSTAVVGIHFSQFVRTSLDANYYGTGLSGDEARRVAGDPILSKRVHFYVDTGNGIQPEFGVGYQPHTVNLNNVYDTTADKAGLVQAWRDGGDPSFNALERALVDNGFDGIYVPNIGGQGVAVLLGPKHTAVPVRPEAQPVYSQERRGGFDIERLAIILNSESDVSTLVHELGHYYLETLVATAMAEGAPQSIKDDVATILRWFGVPDLATWNSMSLEAKQPFHEQFAYSFEVYLFEGQAPTLELSSVFSRVAAWVRRVYHGIVGRINATYKEATGRDLPALTPEVREVFGRILSAEDDIARTEAMRGQLAALSEFDERMTEEQLDAYKKLVEQSRSKAVADLTTKRLQDMRWLSRARNKVLQRLQAAANHAREDMRTEVAAEVADRPVYRALRWLRDGKLSDGDEPAENHKLSRSMVQSIALGGRDLQPIDRLLTDDGVAPDAVAPLFGFASGDQLVAGLLDAPPLEDAIEARLDERMIAEHSDLWAEARDPDRRQAAIDRALHNELRERVLATELSALEGAARPARLVLAGIHEIAERMLSTQTVSSINPKRFAESESRARRRFTEAMAKGDTEGAIAYARQQLLFNVLVGMAHDAEHEVDRRLRPILRGVRQPDAKLAATRDTDYVGAVRAILSGVGLLGGAKLPLEHVALVAAHNPDFYANVALPALQAATQGNTLQDYQSMTLERLRGVLDTVEGLWGLAASVRKVELGEREALLADAAGELSAQLDTLPTPDPVARATSETARDVLQRGINTTKAALRRVESWTESIDGGKPGAWTKLIWRPVRDATTRYRRARREVVKRYVALVDELQLTWQQIGATHIGATFKNKAEVIGAMLHAGNLSNLEKLLRGYGWGELRGNGTLDTSRWDAQVEQWIDDGVLTAHDFQFLQATWDLLEAQKHDLQEAHRRMFGYYFVEVQARPFSNRFGTFRGGYVPAAADATQRVSARLQESMADLSADFRQQVPVAPNGMTKARTGAVRPLSLDVRRMAGHIDQVMRYVHVQPVVRDVYRMLNSVQDKLSMYDPNAIERMLLPWLNRVVHQSTQQRGMLPWIDRFWTVVRQRAGMALMFLNLSNTLQQATGAIVATTKVPASLIGASSVEYLRDHSGMTTRATQASPFLADRLDTQMSELGNELNELVTKPNAFRSVQKWGTKHAYVLQTSLQNVMDVVVWNAAYNHAVAQLGTSMSDTEVHAEAVQRADAAIRLTQQSLAPEDIAAFEAGTPFVKLFTQFSGYFNMLLNLNATAVSTLVRQFGWRDGLGKLTTSAMLGFFVPMILADAIAQTMAGKWDDDDDDGYSDDVAAWFFSALGRSAVAMVPGGNNLLVPFNAFNDKPYDDRILTSPVSSALEQATVGVARAAQQLFGAGELRGRGVRDVLTLLTLLTGAPLSALGRPIGYGLDVNRGKIEPSGALDFVRGVLQGR